VQTCGGATPSHETFAKLPIRMGEPGYSMMSLSRKIITIATMLIATPFDRGNCDP